MLLRNFVDLDNDQKSSLQHLLEINKSLAIAHSMKEQFRLSWECKTKTEGIRFLCWWVIQAIESGVSQLAKTGHTLLYHAEGLLSYFEHKIDNGKAGESTTKLKYSRGKRMAFETKNISNSDYIIFIIHYF